MYILKQFHEIYTDDFCKSVGGRAVSLDSNEKALAMMDLLRQRAQRYMWTGGRIDHNVGVVTWPSGAREGYNRGQRFWSHTGGEVGSLIFSYFYLSLNSFDSCKQNCPSKIMFYLVKSLHSGGYSNTHT